MVINKELNWTRLNAKCQTFLVTTKQIRVHEQWHNDCEKKNQQLNDENNPKSLVVAPVTYTINQLFLTLYLFVYMLYAAPTIYHTTLQASPAQ